MALKKKKLKIAVYHEKFKQIFKKGRERIDKKVKKAEIRHIGSTAVPHLGGKGIIDIMIAFSDWKTTDQSIASFKRLGFKHIHPRENGRIFLSKNKQTGFGDIHLHLVIKNSLAYKQLLNFVNYLKKYPKAAKEYFDFKLKIAKKTGNDRAEYTKLKAGYIDSILRRLKL